ncbi:hypothetical protein [Saccharibacillus brassicae]|uniref:Uncharacterized protein n=1 Tax=Saccharibacillus brassicae TaxID=2583377 RepID=A0A4Y6V1F8_SACBS|nr:hypothetical protein [Saccharibacillus brassicae]QDH22638.1 hypothetical protein FFV09_18380 [Saccharibacillus brassicae]
MGFEVRKIPEGSSKTPDYEVYLNNELVFYCEEKTIEYDDFEGSKSDPTYNSISSQVHKAVKQFKSVNENRELPNVLAFVNFDNMKDAYDLFITLTGYARLESGEYLGVHSVGRVRHDLDQVDLYLWFNKKNFTNMIWGKVHQENHKRLTRIINIEKRS